MTPTYGYCAVKFLDQWMLKEEGLYNALQSPDASSIRAALAYFKVSRGFANIEDAMVGGDLAELLVQHTSNVSVSTAAESVMGLAGAIEKLVGLHNLSAATKLLWLRHRSPFVLLDSRATRALRRLKYKFDARDYQQYQDAWHRAFGSHSRRLRLAISGLPKHVEFTAAATRGKAYVQTLIVQPWFIERTFDQYLWQIGEP